MKGELCGMVNCQVPPEEKCKSCGLWYCHTNHYQAHFTGYPDHKSGKPIF